jgi:hypothetical protein
MAGHPSGGFNRGGQLHIDAGQLVDLAIDSDLVLDFLAENSSRA